MANVLVTGGSGLLGWPTTQKLLDDGHCVVVYDLFPTHENLEGLGGNLHVVVGDVSDLAELTSTMKRFDIDHVVHLAAILTAHAATSPTLGCTVNVIGTANIFEAATALGVRRVVWTSTMAALARGPDYDGSPVAEDHPYAPGTVYGASKYLCEILAQAFRDNHGLDSIGFRPHLGFGLGKLESAGTLLNAPIRNVALGRPATISAWPDLPWQLMYNRDWASLIVSALFGPPRERLIYNAPFSRNYTGEDIRAALLDIVPDADIAVATMPAYALQASPPLLNGERAVRDFGYEERYPLDVAAREMIAYYRANAA